MAKEQEVKSENSEESILEKIKREILNFKKKKETLVNELRLEFPKLLTPLMEESLHIKDISWTQYTPYFNDGDECTFGVNTDYLYVNGDDEANVYREVKSVKIKNEEDLERDKQICEELGYRHYKKKIGDYGYKKNIEYSKSEDKILKNIKKVLSQIPDDFYKDLFGDHSKVTITKEGVIKVDDYEHD
jgi:hypothetical protein